MDRLPKRNIIELNKSDMLSLLDVLGKCGNEDASLDLIDWAMKMRANILMTMNITELSIPV